MNLLHIVQSIAVMHLTYLALQAIPVIAWGALSRRPAGQRATWVGAGGLLIATQLSGREAALHLASTALALGYYFLVGAGLFSAHRWVATGTLRKDALFALLFTALVLIPASFFGFFAAVPMLVIGWHMCLSIYSHSVEVSKNPRHGKFADYLFFVFVDPSVAFPERAFRQPYSKPGWRALGRVSIGLTLMTVGTLVFSHLPNVTHAVTGWIVSDNPYLQLVTWTTVMFFAIYWLRAGTMDVRIALLASLGYSVQECYRRPFLASSPLDFWRRWNVYVGHWARRYLFSPLVLAATRKQRKMGRGRGNPQFNKALAVVVTFLIIGLLHDGLNFAGDHETHFVFTQMFAFAAASLVLWEAGAGLASKAGLVDRLNRRWFVPLKTVASQVALLHYLAGLIFLSGALP